MQRNNDPDQERWFFVPVQPGTTASLRRWDVVIISLLSLLVLGLLLVAIIPQKASSASPAAKASQKMDTLR